MNAKDRMLYHQIHPLKLLTDFTTSFASSWLLWEARWVPALLVAFVPSIFVSILLVRTDLDRYAASPFGAYVAAHMTTRATLVRITGQLVMWIGAIAHLPWMLPLGLWILVVLGWGNGLWRRA